MTCVCVWKVRDKAHHCAEAPFLGYVRLEISADLSKSNIPLCLIIVRYLLRAEFSLFLLLGYWLHFANGSQTVTICYSSNVQVL